MKKLHLLYILGILMFLALPLVEAGAGPARISHEDPSAVKGDSEIALPVLLHYAGVLSLIADSKFSDAKSLMDELNIDEAAIPDDIKYIMRRCNGFLSDLSVRLDRLDDVLVEAGSYLDDMDLANASASLTEARRLVTRCQSILNDIDGASQQLISLLGPLAGSIQVSELEEARQRLASGITGLRDMEGVYQQLVEALEQQAGEIVVTDLTLTLDKDHAWTGEVISIGGLLSGDKGDSGALAGKSISITINGEPLTIATTAGDGSYSVTLPMPFIYMPEAVFQASYTPAGDDATKHLSCTSPESVLELSFYQTSLTMSVNNTQPFVGSLVNITGAITSPEEGGKGLSGRSIRILLDGLLVKTVISGPDGSYAAGISVPFVWQTGRTLAVEYAGGMDEYAPSSEDTPLLVKYRISEISIDESIARQIMTGDTVVVSGTLKLGGVEAAGRLVHIVVDGQVVKTVTTAAEGRYSEDIVIIHSGADASRVEAVYAYAADEYGPAEATVDIDVDLYPTEVSLQVPSEAWVGDPLAISGRLTSTLEGGAGLAGRVLEILVGGEVIATLVTGTDGSFGGSVTPPDAYSVSRTLEVRFAPAGPDITRYANCSASEEIGMLFHSTEIEMDELPIPYPGLPLTLTGRVSYADGATLVARRGSLSLGSQVLATFDLLEDFSVEVVAPEGMGGQDLPLTLSIEGEGRYSSVVVAREVRCEAVALGIEINRTAITSPPRQLSVSGRVVSGLPLGEVRIEVEFAGEYKIVTTNADGEFEAVFGLPLNSIPLGSHSIKVRAIPADKWHAESESTGSIFVVDAMNLGLISLAFVSTGALAYGRLRSRRSRRGSNAEAGLVTPAQSAASPFLPARPLELRQRVLHSYADAVSGLQGPTGIMPAPDATLREYLGRVLPELGEAGPAFADLTRLAEAALYSSRAPSEQEAGMAETLARRIKELLYIEAA